MKKKGRGNGQLLSTGVTVTWLGRVRNTKGRSAAGGQASIMKSWSRSKATLSFELPPPRWKLPAMQMQMQIEIFGVALPRYVAALPLYAVALPVRLRV
jgi:hypothetical protein